MDWIDAYNDNLVEKSKEQAILLNGQAQQIASAVWSTVDKHIKYLELKKLYPELFGKKTGKNLAPEEKTRQEAAAWRSFLGI